MVRIEEAGIEDYDVEDKDKGGGLIDLDMGAWGSGSLNDPLRHAVGLRSAQDQCKMHMWNSFPQLFQNTIFHGEQDAQIKSLRHKGSLQDRLARCRELKEEGTTNLKAAIAAGTPGTAPSRSCSSSATPDADAIAHGAEDEAKRAQLADEVQNLEAAIVRKEQELKALRRKLATARTELTATAGAAASPAAPQGSAWPASEETSSAVAGAPGGGSSRELLEGAITSYEKAAGLLRYVECMRQDWRNEDGSYKGIEDRHLRIDASALEGDSPEAADARELVASCYLNIALACQKLGDLGRMVSACDEVLRSVNPKSVKALYRRAQALVARPSCLDHDRDAAILDLQTAAQIAPQDKEVRSLLAKLKAEKKAQSKSDRSAFAGMFERGEVVTNDPRTEGDKPPKLDLNDPKVQAMLDIHPGPGGFTYD